MRVRTEQTPTETDDRILSVARKRFARRQWARRWLAWRVVLVVVLLVALVTGVVWLVFFSTALAVKGVRVEGTAVLDPRQVQAEAAVPTGSPLATVDLEAIADRVGRLAPVRDVDVSRAWPDQVRIDVVEREAVAVVDRDGTLHGVDAEGIDFRSYQSRPERLPLLRTGPDTPPAAIGESALVIAALPAAVARTVDYVEVRTVDTITLHLRDGRSVLWGTAAESADKARVLVLLLERPGSAYDVSVPGRPVIRP